jgi:hypothetical protein
LSLFLARDGGPREGAIRLLPEKEDAQPPTIPEEESTAPSPSNEEPSRGFVGSLGRKMSHKLSGYFAQRVHDAHAGPNVPSVPMAIPAPRRTFSRTSRANGSAYGYSGGYRNRLASTATIRTRRGSQASTVLRRRGSNVETQGSAPDGRNLNFAQRLLMANENAVVNMADLWVAAAMNVDNEDPFESDLEMDSDVESLNIDEGLDGDGENSIHATPTPRSRVFSQGTTLSVPSPKRGNRRPSTGYRSQLGSPRLPFAPQRPSTPVRKTSSVLSSPQQGDGAGTPQPRRFSSNVPAIFSHPGVRTPPAVLDAQQLLLRSEEPTGTGVDALSPIVEHRPMSQVDTVFETTTEKPPSLSSQLPILIIAQYGLLALHNTTHDQVFMSYLVSFVYFSLL